MIRTTLAALALFTAPTFADEIWTNPAGQLTYETEIGHIAIFSFPSAPVSDATSAPLARVYLPGLAGNYDNRAVHQGYWAVEGGPVCTASLTTPDGTTTQRWGRAEIIFDRAAFPTGFTMVVGFCLDDPTTPIRADLF